MLYFSKIQISIAFFHFRLETLFWISIITTSITAPENCPPVLNSEIFFHCAFDWHPYWQKLRRFDHMAYIPYLAYMPYDQKAPIMVIMGDLYLTTTKYSNNLAADSYLSSSSVVSSSMKSEAMNKPPPSKYSLRPTEIPRAEPNEFWRVQAIFSCISWLIIKTISISKLFTFSIVLPGWAIFKSWFFVLLWQLGLYFPVFAQLGEYWII